MNDIYKQIAQLPADKRKVLELMLMEKGVDLSQMAIIPQPRDENPIPLSFSQQRLWFLDQLEPNSPLYNICSPIRLKGNLNSNALKQSINTIIERHEVLRTTFIKQDNTPYQVISAPFQIEVLEEECAPAEIDKAIYNESIIPFNLEKGPLIRAKHLRLAPNDHVIILTVHHIVSDNWSTAVLIKEIMALYPSFVQDKSVQLEPLPIQYADFAIWQRKWLSGKTLDTQLEFWRNQLAESSPYLEMPTDFPRPAFQTYNGDYKTFSISQVQLQSIKSLCEKHEVTLFMFLQAVLQILLFKYSGQSRFSIGAPIANRNRSETENLIGFFINTLVLNAHVELNPNIEELLDRIKKHTIGALDHQDIPFETLVEKLEPRRSMSHTPFFQVMLVLNNAPMNKLNLPELELEILEPENKSAKFDLVFNFFEETEQLDIKVEFNTDLYKTETVTRMAGHFIQIAEDICAAPHQKISEFSLLTEQEKKLLLPPSPKIPENDIPLLEHILTQAKLNADMVAIQTEKERLTYGQMIKKAYGLAQEIRTRVAAPQGKIIAVMADRSPEMIWGMLGVMLSGATFLPLDPNYPIERLQYMLNDSHCTHLICKKNNSHSPALNIDNQLYFEEISEQEAAINQIEEKSSAYIIYTSGSTGNPKGVLVSHAQFNKHIRAMSKLFAIKSNENVLQFAALNFDASLEQIFTTLFNSATLVLREEQVWPVAQFMDKVAQYKLDVVNLPTAYWNQLTHWLYTEENRSKTFLHIPRLVISGGDTMQVHILEQWQQSALGACQLLNAYGPTEAIITASVYNVSAENKVKKSSVPIGKPCGARQFYLLDAFQQPVPVGFAGELYIAGNLAQGYHNLTQETQQRFVTLPHIAGDTLLYKSGDKVKLDTDGNYLFLGRVDAQVKVRGFRIEPAEIETALMQHSAVQQALVHIGEDAIGEKQLLAYFIPHVGMEPAISELRSHLKKLVPEFMLPALIIPLSAFPMLPSGKVDRKSLKIPDDIRAQLSKPYVAPRNKSESTLAEIVSDVLKVDKVGIHDNFFELGGHSMLGTMVVSLIAEKFAVELPLRTLFEAPTVEEIAMAIAELQAEEESAEELDAMLDELEGLSDEEIAKMLEE